jgi:hypothetical protein
MNTESPRLRALLAAGAALVVFGITIPATASPESPNPNRPGVGTVGMAEENAHPKKQSLVDGEDDGNNGFRCDNNGGAGVGNPALGACGDKTENVQPGNGGGNPGIGGPGDGYTDTGGGDAGAEWGTDS